MSLTKHPIRLFLAIALAIAMVLGLIAAAVIGTRQVVRRVEYGRNAPPAGITVDHLTIDSHFVNRQEHQAVVVPAGIAQDGRSLLIFLHGRGGNENSGLSSPFFTALGHLGSAAPVVVFPDGGDSSYWHDRKSGQWQHYITDEVLPQVIARYHIDPKRIAIGGISMGGFGALDIARLYPSRFCAAGGHSPALWLRSGQTASGAFDDAEDFHRNDVIAAVRANPHVFGTTKLWIDAGTADPFGPGVQAFGAALAGKTPLELHRWPGNHEGAYWDKHWNDYLGFYATALASCSS